MARFRLVHSSSPKTIAYYGLDHALGWFAEVVRADGTRATYDRLTPGCGYEEAGCAVMEGLLHWLVGEGFFSMEELHDVLVARQDGEEVPEGLGRVADVVENLKEAADPE